VAGQDRPRVDIHASQRHGSFSIGAGKDFPKLSLANGLIEGALVTQIGLDLPEGLEGCIGLYYDHKQTPACQRGFSANYTADDLK
jgi:hypothetical protein